MIHQTKYVSVYLVIAATKLITTESAHHVTYTMDDDFTYDQGRVWAIVVIYRGSVYMCLYVWEAYVIYSRGVLDILYIRDHILFCKTDKI